MQYCWGLLTSQRSGSIRKLRLYIVTCHIGWYTTDQHATRLCEHVYRTSAHSKRAGCPTCIASRLVQGARGGSLMPRTCWRHWCSTLTPNLQIWIVGNNSLNASASLSSARLAAQVHQGSFGPHYHDYILWRRRTQKSHYSRLTTLNMHSFLF